MASTPQFSVASIQLRNYKSLVMLTTIGYDYILTFPREVEYIWSKPWTWVSTMFVFVRYFGASSVVSPEFLPLWGVLSYLAPKDVLYVFEGWAFLSFIGTADLVMILRVWALYNRSRLILGVLLPLHVIQIIAYLIWCVLASAPNGLVVAIAQVLDFQFCIVQPGTSIWLEIAEIVQISLGALMCFLVATQFIRESLQMYRATKQLRLNRYMNLLSREGMIYFLAILPYTLLDLLANAGNIPKGRWAVIIPFMVEYVPAITLVPRFILTVRELHARDLQRRRGSEIDTGFGLSSASGHGVVTIIFADGGEYEVSEQGEEMPMEEVEVGSDAWRR